MEPAASPAPPAPARRGLGPPLRAFALDVLIAGTAMLLLSLVGGMVWAAWRGIRHGLDAGGASLSAPSVGSPGVLAMVAITAFSTGGAALLTCAWRRPPSAAERRRAWHALRRGSTWIRIVAITALVFLCSSAVSTLGEALQAPLAPTNLPLIEEGFASHPVLLTLFAVGVAPAYEELLFRRVLFGRLWQAGYPVLGMALSAALFALLHEFPGAGSSPLGTTLLWAAYATMGVAFAWLYRRTGTLWAPIAAHALNNALALVFVAT